MPITVPDIISEQGKSDAKRHREKQREVIRKNLPHIIANENIITGKRDKIIKIPIKSLEIPRFKPDETGDGAGIGQGEGEPGDIIGHQPGKSDSEQGGTEPGEELIETEIRLEELIEMMLEDLGLPKLEEKELKTLILEIGYQLKGLRKTGPWSFLDSKATGKEGLKIFYSFLQTLEKESGLPELVCFDALKQANGDLGDALNLLKDPNFKSTSIEVAPFSVFAKDELRYKKLEPKISYQSQAVVIAMMDVSGSMYDEKKYLAGSILFWLVAFLQQIYEQVEIRFIIHHTEARIVDEETFFHTEESGGTFCYTAYELANELVRTEYPPSQYNIYVWHFSDGDDVYPEQTVEQIEKLIEQKINMLGYGEVEPSEKFDKDYPESVLMNAIHNFFDVQIISSSEIVMISGKEIPLLGLVIQTKEQLLPALKQFLKKDRWANG